EILCELFHSKEEILMFGLLLGQSHQYSFTFAMPSTVDPRTSFIVERFRSIIFVETILMMSFNQGLDLIIAQKLHWSKSLMTFSWLLTVDLSLFWSSWISVQHLIPSTTRFFSKD
ncbi:hypothetical protein SJ945_14365, partial [Enterococcus faecium]